MAKITFHHFLLLELLLAIFLFSTCVQAITDPTDVQALQVLYTSLNNAAQLTNWKNNVGDPCGESWRGITCQGTAVVSIALLYGNSVCNCHDHLPHKGRALEQPRGSQLPGLGLDGTLGYLLAGFVSLKTLDFSGNNIHDTIPYQLPPNLTSVNFANNNLSGGLPYSIAMMFNLNYVNLSRNALAQNIVDVFTNLTSLATLDLSHNNFTGDLPNSISSLSNITTLNIANNNFTGWIPRELLSLPTFIYDGNSFENGPAPPPPPYTSPPPARSNNNRSRSPPSRIPTDYDGQSSNTSNRKKLSVGAIIGISVGSAFLVLLGLLVLVFCFRKGKKKKNARKTSIGSRPISVNTEIQEQRVKPTASMLDLRSSPAEDSMFELQKDGSTKRVRSPITATSYTVAALQTATNSFSQENIIGEGSLGRVYKAEFPNGKMMAIKKIDNAALSLPDQDKFVEAVSNMSRLRHPNIVLLAGYCAEHGQRLLVYEYVANGSLQDLLHLADDRSKSLTWNALAMPNRYLHEVCLPSVVHRNFKSANILLDEDLNPHLSDCGLAALTPNTEREPEPEFRPPMSEVVQALVRLMQRASIANRRTSEDSGFIYRTPDHEAYETTC
ncbi:Concanavalin A-like lectin/glucanase, subgroup [Cynara cardunculus var. scolymus]|uniref:Concanavalin A-like lectin/glucanase, subgroup n=1 Tax=Cynara cardunculus var. scolymus TaxID=59895 RepID=A0A103Y238_CYNCS|nr:Concanavalin A-like lectin/glucanase, subgroup [Cynara cardunculus var. scolymus]